MHKQNTIREIKTQLRARNLPVGGNEDEIRKRLSQAMIDEAIQTLPGTTITPGPNAGQYVEQQLANNIGGLHPSVNLPVTFGAVLGSGAEGATFACNLQTPVGSPIERDVVCKVGPLVGGMSSLEMEYAWLQRLYTRGVPVPRPIAKYTGAVYTVIIMQRLNHTLKEILEANNGRFSPEEATGIMQRMLPILEKLHGNGDVYVDIKPANIMTDFSEDPREQQLYLIDPGLLRAVGSPLQGKHEGTPRYTSIDAHMGNPLGASSDLQALGYMISSFIRGDLPWDAVAEDDNVCRQILTNPNNHLIPVAAVTATKPLTMDQILDCVAYTKMHTSADELAPGYPQLREYLDYVMLLRATDQPDYAYLKSIFDTPTGTGL